MNKLFVTFFLVILATAEILQAEPHRLSIEPMVYHTKRTRDGGTWQKGILYGIQAKYERLCPWGFYWSVDGHYASGTLHGENLGGLKLKSELSDSEIHGRLGFTIALGPKNCFSLTAFGGYGYFSSWNKFKEPSTLPIHFHNTFDFGSAGLMLQWRISKCWEIGLNYTLKWMIEGKCQTSNDPDFEDSTLYMTNRLQYEIEVPVWYRLPCKIDSYLGLIPFFKHRAYGGQENFPFDFRETEFQIYGLQFAFLWNF